MADLLPCPFCSKTMMLRSALWPSEGDADAIIHADPTDCPMLGFSDGSADGSIIEKWNCSLSNEDDFPSDGSCVRCGSVPRNANGLCNTCLDEDAERLENTRTIPVAPLALETVMRRYRGTDWPDHYPWAFLNESECQGEPGPRWIVEKLCLQSQAEEILAAERAEKERLRGLLTSATYDLARANDECGALTIDNAAKDARVEELIGTNIAVARRQEELANQLAETKGLLKTADDLAWQRGAAIEALEAKLAAAEKIAQEVLSLIAGDAGIPDRIRAKARATLGGKPS